MVTHGDRTATGVLLKGVDPTLMPSVLDLPKHVVEGSLAGLRRADARPPERAGDLLRDEIDRFEIDSPSQDAGNDSLLARIRQEVDEEVRQADAGAPRGPTPKRAGPPDPSLPRTMEARSITPSGGYRSQLPDDDYVPDAIDPDPCTSPDRVARLPGIVVGRSLAKQLSVGLGDCVQVTSPQIGLSFGTSARSPIAKQFRVIAIFEAGFDQYDSKLVYTDLYEAQAFYEYGDSVTGLEMKVADIDQAHKISGAIEKLLSNGIYHTMDWQELNHGLFTALLFQRIAMSSALALIILVAACTVIATLIMVVLEKKKEISVLKAIGAKNDAILRIFVYQGGIIGLTGTAVGLLLGWISCRFLLAYAFPLDPKVYFISRLPVSMRPIEFLVPAAVAVAICLVATLFPAAYAAKLRPADGLRAE
jgi:lipoprotein-releasing system permease protein